MKESNSNDLIHLGINSSFVVFFFGILCGVVTCIIKCYKNDDEENHDHGNINDHVITITKCAGIKPSVLRSIPVVDFNSQDFKCGVECVVCLSELVDGDKARVLPSCNHWFHADCIDSWFRSHSTCHADCIDSVQLGDDESLTQNHDPGSEHPAGFPTGPPRSTDTVVLEDGEANEGRLDLTEVVIDIPVKRIESLSARSTE